jgi:glucose-1-phosphate thymidylyltransferase
MLIPIGGRPFLDYSLQELLDAGYRRVCLVVPPPPTPLQDYYEAVNARTEALDLTFAVQEKPRGTADAVAAAREFAGDDSFLVVNGDNLYSTPVLQTLREAEEGACCCIGYDREALIAWSNIEADRIARFAVVQADAEGNLRRIVEKPDRPEDYAVEGRILISMNCWRFTPAIFTACAAIGPDPGRGEWELTAAVQYVIDQDLAPFRVIPVQAGVLDLTGRRDITSVQEALAERKLSFG